MEALQRLHNRGSISTGYDIDNSCKFEDDNDEWLYRANVSGTNTKTWTVSWWFKQTELRSGNGAATEHWTGGAYGEATRAGIFADDRIWIDIGGGDGNTGTLFRSLSTQLIRDTSAWYHIVIACDSTQSTEANRLKVWLNGVEVTAWDQKQYPTLNFGSALAGFGGIQMKWGSADATYHGYSGYLAECNYLDGVTATQNDFGEFDDASGIWKPKAYTGSYGTNGTYLDFADASDLGDDESGNGNDYTENNITAADQATDTPTNNFCTLNTNSRTNANIRNQEGGSKVTTDGGSGWCSMNATMGVRSGKWYWEAEHMSSDSNNVFWGVAAVDDPYIPHRAGGYYLGNVAGQTSMGLYSYNGQVYNGTWQNGTGHLANSSNDVLMFALDADNGYMYFGTNGTWGNSSDPTTTGGTAAATLSTTQTNPWTDFIVPSVSVYQGMQTTFNFGGYTAHTPSSAASDANGYGTFEYAPPSGYYALCTKNLEEFG
jgi:hypothetical protein